MDELLITTIEIEVLREIGKTPYEPPQEEKEELALGKTSIYKHFQTLNTLLQFMVF
jgi:hypothetical protein